MNNGCCAACGAPLATKIGEGVRVDVAKRTLSHGARTVRLSPIEARMVGRLAAARPGSFVDKWSLADAAYADAGLREPCGPDRVVVTTMHKLRRRLGGVGLRVQNQMGDGYRLEAASGS